jgi:hypothetical protein
MFEHHSFAPKQTLHSSPALGYLPWCSTCIAVNHLVGQILRNMSSLCDTPSHCSLETPLSPTSGLCSAIGVLTTTHTRTHAHAHTHSALSLQEDACLCPHYNSAAASLPVHHGGCLPHIAPGSGVPYGIVLGCGQCLCSYTAPPGWSQCIKDLFLLCDLDSTVVGI